MKQKLMNLKLTEIAPNPKNFRRTFDGPDMDELVESIRQKGVIQPILVRPKKKGKKAYELVFGERRFRAAKAASKKKGGEKTIPALVRELNASDAYDIMLIENLQREDLTELEEADGFKAYLDKNGDEALAYLSERTGIKASYIRRRVSVLSLPGPILEAWGNGKIKYGYLEQLSRLDDESEIMDIFENIIEDGWDFQTVRELKQYVDNKGIKLEFSVFDLEKNGCLSCNHNSDVQFKLFDIDSGSSRCRKEDCFIEKQKAHLDSHWPTTDFRKKFKTNGYRFNDDVARHQCNIFGHGCKPVKQCFQCDAFVSIFTGPRLNINFQQACIGGDACFKKNTEKKKANTEGKTGDSGQGKGPEDGPRVSWHGDHFREVFFKDAIPQRFESVAPGELQAVQLALFALVKSDVSMERWFLEKYTDTIKDDEYFYRVSDTEIFQPIAAMDSDQASGALKAAALHAVLSDTYLAEGRRLVAEHVGIDISKEWSITEEYLSKKHIPEILGMGERLGIFADPKAKAYMADAIKKEDYGKCKKKELVQIILESGVDLVGKVPDEILKK